MQRLGLLAVSANSQLRTVLFGRFLIIVCLSMSDPYWPLIVKQYYHTASETTITYWAAAIYILPFLITILTTPFWTRLGDRFGHKKMLLRATVALVVTQWFVSYLTNPWLVLGMRVAQGFFAGFNAAGQAWLIAMTRSTTHSHVVGRLQASTAIGTVVGPMLGGMIANFLGYDAIFQLSAILCLGVAVMLLAVIDEAPTRSLHKQSGVPSFRLSNIHYILLTLVLATQAARFMCMPFLALYVTEHLHGDAMGVGWLYSCLALFIFISAPRFGILLDKNIDEPVFTKWLLFGVLIIAGVAQLIYANTTQLYVALAASVIYGSCLGATSVIPYSMLVRIVPASARSYVIGLGTSTCKLGNLIGVCLGALLQHLGGYAFSFAGIALIYLMLASFLVAIKSLPEPVHELG